MSISARVESLESRTLLAAGQLDPTFGDGGIAQLQIIGHGNDTSRVVAVQRDGKILVAGETDQASGIHASVVRYLPDGTPDATFGDGGRALSAYGDTSTIAVQRDGRIVVAGSWSEHSQFTVGRFLADGTPDPTFSSLGVRGIGAARPLFFLGRDDAAARGLAVRPDGRIIIAIKLTRVISDFPNYKETFQAALIQLTPTGWLDSEFGENGILTAGTAGGEDEIDFFALRLRPDGSVIVAGTSHGDFLLMRLAPDGRWDQSFGGSASDPASPGQVRMDFGSSSDSARALVELQDGRLVAVGQTGGDIAIARFLPDGLPDRTLGYRGGAVIDSGISNSFRVTSAHRAARGRLVVTGIVTAVRRGTNPFVLRVLPGGKLDSTFATRGWLAASPFLPRGPSISTAASALAPDGGFIVASAYFTMNPGDFLVGKFTASGAHDAFFGAGVPKPSDPLPPQTNPGVVITDLPGPASVTVTEAIALSNGKIITFGESGVSLHDGYPYTTRDMLSRWNADGTLDATFGSGGQVRAFFDWGAANVRFYEQANGVVLAVYEAWHEVRGNGRPCVAFRWIAPDGTCWPPLHDRLNTFAALDGEVIDSTLDTAGRILVIGGRRLGRILADGTPDSAFGIDGAVKLPDGVETRAVAAAPDGRIVVAWVTPGAPNGTGAGGQVVVARYLANGSPDLSFGDNGTVSVPRPEGTGDRTPRLLVQDDGRVVVAALRSFPPPDAYSWSQKTILFRFKADGKPDSTFGEEHSGSVVLAPDIQFSTDRLLSDAQGRLLVFHSIGQTIYGMDTAVTRLTRDGLLDASFGPAGAPSPDDIAATSTMHFDPEDDEAGAMTMQSDGKIVVVSYNRAGGKMFLARLTAQ